MSTDLQARSTIQPTGANLRVTTDPRDLTDDERMELAIDLNSAWIAAESARAQFDENLRAFSALYEQEVEEQDEPWVNAANLVLPIISSELDSMWAYIAGQVFVQRLIIVTAADNDPETARLAPIVEKFYNSEIRRIRQDGKTPIEQFLTVLHLGLRDGGGPLDVLFSERKEPRLILEEVPKVDDGLVVLGDDGMPETERTVTRVEETVAEVTVIPHLLKDWYLNPAESTSIQTALGIAVVTWMTEKQMWEKVHAGIFRAEDVEEVLLQVVAGTSDVTKEKDGAYDKDAGGQIGIGQGQGTMVSKFFRNRGPVRLIRYFTEEFDLNGDGVPEKNICWHYPDYPRLLGYAPYEYADGSWPTFCFSPFPRPNRPYGYSLVERLADIAADANAGRNQRRNYIDLGVMPPLLLREGDTLRDKDGAFGPGVRWVVEDPEKSIRWFTLPNLPPDSFQDSAELNTWIAKVTGQSAPAVGAQSSGRRTATESRQQQAAQSVRVNLVALEFRSFLRAVMQFWHKLNIQYLGAATQGPTTNVPPEVASMYPGSEAGALTLTPDILKRKFNIDIAGLSDPIDAGTRRQEFMLALTSIPKVFPWILQDPVLSFNLAEYLFELFQIEGTERFVGTPEEAQQRKEQMAQQMQSAAMNPQQQPQKQGGQ